MPQSVSVTNLDTFRWWQSEEELDLEWLLSRLRGEEETEAMRVGRAFHEALECAEQTFGEMPEKDTITAGGYRFDFNCDCAISLSPVREASLSKSYGDLLVRGRVDAIVGKEITDYKVTQKFDPDRLLEGYQWRYYLDMADCDRFVWKVFVVREFAPPDCYEVREAHTLVQHRYPGLHADCLRLAQQYVEFTAVESLKAVEG